MKSFGALHSGGNGARSEQTQERGKGPRRVCGEFFGMHRKAVFFQETQPARPNRLIWLKSGQRGVPSRTRCFDCKLVSTSLSTRRIAWRLSCIGWIFAVADQGLNDSRRETSGKMNPAAWRRGQ